MQELEKLHSFLAELGAQMPLGQFDEVVDRFEPEEEEPLDEVLGEIDTLQQRNVRLAQEWCRHVRGDLGYLSRLRVGSG